MWTREGVGRCVWLMAGWMGERLVACCHSFAQRKHHLGGQWKEEGIREAQLYLAAASCCRMICSEHNCTARQGCVTCKLGSAVGEHLTKLADVYNRSQSWRDHTLLTSIMPVLPAASLLILCMRHSACTYSMPSTSGIQTTRTVCKFEGTQSAYHESKQV